MSKFENLNDLIEGRLSDSNSKGLYAELASDSALREEMKNLLSVNNTVSSNRSMFVPLSASKDAIFGKIGLATTGAAIASFWNSKAFYSALSSVATLIVVTAAYFGFMQNGNAIDENGVKTQEHELAANYSLPEINLELLDDELKYSNAYFKSKNMITSTEKRFNSVKKFDEEANIENTLALNKKGDFIESDELKNEIYDRKSSSSNRAKHLLNKSNGLSADNQIGRINSSFSNYSNKLNSNIKLSDFGLNSDYQSISMPRFENQNELINSNVNPLSKFAIEWNTSESVHIPEERITPSEFAAFHKNSLSLLYKQNNRLTFGANARQETFYLVFNGLGADGIERIYEQQPNLTSVSGLVRYDLFELDSDMPFGLESFTELQFGANRLGPVGRLGVGLEIQPTRNITFVVSGQYSQLRYWHQELGFKTEKFSLNYGVKFGF